MELQVGVKVLLKNSEGKYLLLQRSSEQYPDASGWDIPGGRIDAGTELIKNLMHEVQEETGLTLDSAPKLIAAQDILKDEDKHMVRLTYAASVSGEIQLTDEYTASRWVSFDGLRTTENLDSYLSTLINTGVITAES